MIVLYFVLDMDQYAGITHGSPMSLTCATCQKCGATFADLCGCCPKSEHLAANNNFSPSELVTTVGELALATRLDEDTLLRRIAAAFCQRSMDTTDTDDTTE
jgi:hypothetical protein